MPEEDNNNEELRPTKMRGVVFPKAKYVVIIEVIVPGANLKVPRPKHVTTQ